MALRRHHLTGAREKKGRVSMVLRRHHLTWGYREERKSEHGPQKTPSNLGLERRKGCFVCQVILKFQLQPKECVVGKLLDGAIDDTVKNALPQWKGYSPTGMVSMDLLVLTNFQCLQMVEDQKAKH